MKDIKRQVTAALGDMRTVVFTRRKFDLLLRPTRDRIAAESKDDGDGNDGQTEGALAAAVKTRVNR